MIDSVTGESKVDPIRTSEQTFLNRGKWDIVTKVEERLAVITQLPAYHGEGGETAFPDSEWMTPELKTWADGQKWSECAEVTSLLEFPYGQIN